jgi:hypothetical protein
MTAAQSPHRYNAPPRPNNPHGQRRKVGIELEIGHLPLELTLDLVQRSLGGAVKLLSPAEGKVEDTPLGSFGVELDSLTLKERAYLRPLELVGLEPESTVSQLIENSVVRVARELVPIEVVTPPIPWDRLGELDGLWSALRVAGAEDTRASLLYAFGMHLNPEAPDFETSTILGHLQAFLLLEPWLSAAMQVDVSRRIAPYIRDFPVAYTRLILAPGYAPDWDAFIADYLSHNPTRNRPLDLVPLFVHVTGSDLSASVEEWALVKARPTFHYRLPNSEVQQPGWSPAIDWNRWVEVEKLASSPELLMRLRGDYEAMSEADGPPPSRPWLSHLQMRLGLPILGESLSES